MSILKIRDSTDPFFLIVLTLTSNHMISSIKKLIFPVYASVRYFFAKWKYIFPEIMDSEATLGAIKSRNLSNGRYGDGEMTLLMGVHFVGTNCILTNRFKEVIQSDRSDFLVGVPYSLQNAKILKPSARRFWKRILAFELKFWHQFISGTPTKGDALISRFWMDYLDKGRAGSWVRRPLSWLMTCVVREFKPLISVISTLSMNGSKSGRRKK